MFYQPKAMVIVMAMYLPHWLMLKGQCKTEMKLHNAVNTLLDCLLAVQEIWSSSHKNGKKLF